MALTLSNYDPLLKDLYEGSIREQLNNEIPLFKMLDETDKEWSGRRVVFPIHTTRNSGVGARAEGGTLPSAGQQGYESVVVSATYQYGRGQVSGQAVAAGKHAFAAALASEMDGLTQDLKIDLGRQSWGTGDGRLCQIGADGASASALSVYNRYFEPGQPGARFINQNMLLDGGSVAAPTQDFSSATVASVSRSLNPATTTDTVTISISSVTVSQCDTYLFVRGAGGAGIESLGMQAIVDVFSEGNCWGSNAFYGSAIQGINRATVQAWNASVLGNSGVARIIDSNLMEIAFNTIQIDTGESPDCIMGEHSVVRAFLDSVAADRRYVTGGTPSYEAGYSGLSYNGVRIERDRFAPYNSLLVFKRDAIKKFTLKDIGFADEDGAILSRVSNQDAWEFWVSTYYNLGMQGNMKSALFIRDIKTDF